MNNLLQIVSDEQTSEFYPTPPRLVERMFSKIKLCHYRTILEPSAGKGDILRHIGKYETREYGRPYRGDGTGHFEVDCIEIDPNLRQVLKYNFGERKEVLKRESRSIKEKYKYCNESYGRDYKYYDDNTRSYKPLPHNDLERLRGIDAELDTFIGKGIHIVHDDFLTYSPFKQYDLIIMNPPFSNGDKHLLKALKIQKDGGDIVCLLNAETIRNPYTETRKHLRRLLNEYGAEIEYIEDAFTTAERRTGVEVALIKVSIPHTIEESDIYNRMREAERMEDFDPVCTELEVTDYIKAAVSRFRVEVKAGLELIRQYRALVPYMMTSFDPNDKYSKPILRLTDSNERGYDSVSVNDYLKIVRSKYWEALLSNPKFVGKLTAKLQEEYRKRVERLADYDFTEYNIATLSTEMNAQIKRGIEEEIIVMYDRLTEEHTFHPEIQKNRHYFDGWKTNKAYKIDKKVIIPTYGVWGDWDGRPRVYNAVGVLSDLEKVLNYLDGGMTEEVNLSDTVERHFNAGITKNIPCKYFTATFYKKGTVHLTFTCPELIERYNIYAAQNKNWLPPTYGKKRYTDMTAEEKAVVDSFQGEAAYNTVMEKAGYYLAPVTNAQMLLLESGA